jgi:hypothetical protein
MTHLRINDIIDIEFEVSKKKQLKTTVVIEPFLKNIINGLKAKPVYLNIAQNGRKQIKFIRRLQPIKWN